MVVESRNVEMLTVIINHLGQHLQIKDVISMMKYMVDTTGSTKQVWYSGIEELWREEALKRIYLHLSPTQKQQFLK